MVVTYDSLGHVGNILVKGSKKYKNTKKNLTQFFLFFLIIISPSVFL